MINLICSIGPKVTTIYDINNMINKGMNIARFNFSHINYKKSEEFIDHIHENHKEVKILGDIQGNKIRVSKLFKNREMYVDIGQVVIFSTEDYYLKNLSKTNVVPISYNGKFHDILDAKEILMKDATMKFEIIERNDKYLVTKTILGGVIRKEKGINAKGMKRKYTILSKKDKFDVQWCLKRHVDIICLSYVTGKNDIRALKNYIRTFEKNIENFKMPQIMAKVECIEAFENLDDIAEEADSIMLGRGDLKSEIDIEEIPILQKKLVDKMESSKKDLIIATYVLDSLKKSKVPSISEVNDIFNFIKSNVNGFMLCGEVSISNYFLDNIEFMDKLIKKYEI